MGKHLKSRSKNRSSLALRLLGLHFANVRAMINRQMAGLAIPLQPGAASAVSTHSTSPTDALPITHNGISHTHLPSDKTSSLFLVRPLLSSKQPFPPSPSRPNVPEEDVELDETS